LGSFFIYLFRQFWGLNSESHIALAGALPLEPLCQPHFVLGIF
jgi:hypothetical protein